MSDYAKTARQMAAEYRQLSDQAHTPRAEMDALGRTDVPLSDPSHVNNMDGDTRDAWLQKHRVFMLKSASATTWAGAL